MESQKILFVIFFKVSKYALSFIFFYLMIIFYEPSVIGTVRFAISFVAIFSFIFNLGFTIAHLKIYPEEEDKAASIGALLIFKIFFILISLIFYFILLSFFKLNEIILQIIIIFIFEQIIQGINSSMTNILIADNEIIKGSFPWVIVSSSKIALLILGLFIFPTNVLLLSLIYLFSTLFHTGFLLIYIIPYKIKKPTKKILKKYLKYTYPLSFSSIAVLISENIGIILINFWISPEAVAYYYAGDHLSVFRTILPNIISLVMLSIFSKNIKDSKSEKNMQIIRKISKYLCIFWGMVIILSFSYSDEFILIFMGDAYYQSIFVFNILILTHIIVINDVAVFTDLNARGLTKLFSIIKFIGEIYNIFLTIYFVAPFGLNLGINGLALSILFRYITYTPIVRLYLWKKYKYPYNFGIFLYLGVAFITFLITNIITSNFDLVKQFYLIPIFALISISLYFGLLYLLKGINKEDLKYFKLFLNIKLLINILYEDLAVKNNKSKNNRKIG